MPERPRIGIWLTRTDPYWVQINEAIFMRAQHLPVDLIPLEAALEFGGPSDLQPDRLSEDLLSFGLSAVITTYIPRHAALRLLDAGLPIIQLTETEFEHRNLVSFEGYYDCALLAGKYVANRLNGRGRILVIGGLWGNHGEGGRSRIEAIADVVREFPGLTCRHIPAPWPYEQALPVIEEALSSDLGPIDAVVGISDPLVLATRNALRALGLGANLPILVGINGDPLALAAVADGSLTATVETDSACFGRDAMDVAFDLALGKPSLRSLSVHAVLVTAENVGELALRKLISIADIPSRLVGINREAEQFRVKQLETVTAINQRIGGLLNWQNLLHEVAEHIQNEYHYNDVMVYRWDELAGTLLPEYPPGGMAMESPLTIEQAGLLGDVALKGEAVFIPDTFRSLHYAPDPAFPQTRSRAVLPIRHNQKVIGVLDLHSSRSVPHLRHELLGLQLLADQVGIAGQNTTLYEQAVAARATAERADQMKTRLLANVSHELRAPINLILGYSQMALKEPNSLPASLRGDLGQIYQSGEHLARLISDLLDMSRLEIGALDLFPEVLAPRPFLANVFRNMTDNAHLEGVTWRLDLPDDLPLIQADAVRLRQILLNLLSNASKFTTEGEIVLGAQVEPPHLHLWVSDTGVGILPEEQENIFEPFFSGEQLQRRSEGIGLGLSITRRLVALHDGSMSLESKLGEGSTFHIYLPLPGLTGPSLASPRDSTASVLLLISRAESPGANILQLSQRQGLHIERITSVADLRRLNRPAVLAWDMATAHPDDWALIAQLRRFPHLCRLPFIVYNQQTGATGLTNVLVKPVAQANLLEMLESLHVAGDRKPILVVDDDPAARAMLTRLLADAFPGVPVQLAADGQVALEMLASMTPGLVILDLMMPRVDGFTVLEQMRSDPRWQSTPVLVMSGKLLTEQDVRRLDYARVVFQSKELLAPEETIAALQDSLTESRRLAQPTSVLVKRALAFIHQNYASSLTRQQIANAVSVSEGYLSEIFKQEMGLSPWDQLNRLRIQRACELLKSSNATITEIATQVGFDDPSYFGRVFAKQVGMSPKAFRER